MDVKKIRDTLRCGEDKSLIRRRWIAFLSAIGLIDFSIISLYQMGFIRRLPDLPGKIFDSNKVNASRHAYGMGLPDGPVSAGIYSLNLILGSYKGSKESGRPLIADLALAGTVFVNAAGAASYMKNMIREQEKACPYCIMGALINFISIPFVALDLWDKLKNIREQKKEQPVLI